MKKSLLFILCVIFLSGCGAGDRYQFSGSSEHWEVIYTVDRMDEDSQTLTGTITYIGEGQAPEEIDYMIDTNSGQADGHHIDVENGSVSISTSGCDGCAIFQPDHEITVEIYWDGQSERMKLENDS